MKVKLIPFQEKAVKELRVDIAEALDNYRRRKRTQVVSLQAPTGAGKTIIAAGLIEDIFFGATLADGTTFEEQPEAIFVWLSDSQTDFWPVCYHCRGFLRYGNAGGRPYLLPEYAKNQQK